MIESDQEFLERACAVPLQDATTRALAKAGVELLLRRDDLIDPDLSGNKVYKLFYNLRAAYEARYEQVLSFGGAYSNHLHALALAGARYGFKTLGVVRGEKPKHLSPTLMDAQSAGMRLVFMGRGEYREKSFDVLLERWRAEFGDFYLIPEGGAGVLGAQGMGVVGRAIGEQLGRDVASVCIACGTGTSLAGLAAGLAMTGCHNKPVIGFSVLKGEGDLGTAVATMYRELNRRYEDPLKPEEPMQEAQGAIAGSRVATTPMAATRVATNWRLISGFHGGGYGKKHPDYLVNFWHEFEQETGILLDPIYTLKMLWGIHSLAAQGYWPKGSRILAVHTGGLQGRRGFPCPK